MHDIKINLDRVSKNCQNSALQSNRTLDEITLIAVSKTFSADEIRPILDAGHRVFGENRVQEAQNKWPGLCQDYEHVELHLI